ncbi:MAG TPA: SGNH/GDSL hydrolase family protein [Desulfobacteraceae bacterium]|nr:SGNH/GDSL hydrolase family protein [Desulfobacteraceae bacterium]HPQ27474.1 SGNH/GDSL hydrolase family protein [Desulfobacteraceae bacterium]
MMKRFLIGTAVIGLIGVILCVVYIRNETTLDKFNKVPMRAVPGDRDESLKIGVIGDSWVAGQKLDLTIEQTMTGSGFKTQIVSSGHPGAKSRQIYRDLFLQRNVEHSSNSLLMDEDLDFLVVVAGVNDSAGHIGKTFYAHHMFLIIQTALARGIKPVVVEVPEYGIEDTTSSGFLSWGKRTIYLWLFDNGNVDVIKEYRKALREKIQASGIADKVLLVDFSPITDDYNNSKALYANPSHLNHDGYSKLGKLIAHSIEEWHNRVKGSD